MRALRKSWEDISDDRGVQTMKDEMLSSPNRRFSDAESNKYLVLATMLDPSFKIFSDRLKRANAKTLLEAELSGLLVSNTSSSSTDATEPPAEKKARTSIMKAFDEILKEEGIFTVTTASSTSSLQSHYCPTTVAMFNHGGKRTKSDLSLLVAWH